MSSAIGGSSAAGERIFDQSFSVITSCIRLSTRLDFDESRIYPQHHPSLKNFRVIFLTKKALRAVRDLDSSCNSIHQNLDLKNLTHLFIDEFFTGYKLSFKNSSYQLHGYNL